MSFPRWFCAGICFFLVLAPGNGSRSSNLLPSHRLLARHLLAAIGLTRVIPPAKKYSCTYSVLQLNCFKFIFVLTFRMDFAISTSPLRGSLRGCGQKHFSRQETGPLPSASSETPALSLLCTSPSTTRGTPELSPLHGILTRKGGRGGIHLGTQNSPHLQFHYPLFFHILAHTFHKPTAQNLPQLSCFYALPHTWQNNGGWPPLLPAIFQFPFSIFRFSKCSKITARCHPQLEWKAYKEHSCL